MEPSENQTESCPHCHRSIWEYDWQDGWLEPFTILKDRYEIGAAVSVSSQSVVYIAFDSTLEKRVAVKEYTMEKWDAAGHEICEKWFGLTDLTGILPVTDYFATEDKGYQVTEYVPGGTLQQSRNNMEDSRKGFEKNDLGTIMEGLTSLHSRGMVYGVISPDHLILDGGGKLCMLPNQWKDGSEITKYTAPELEHRPEYAGPWTDVYSVCVLGSELMFGQICQTADQRLSGERGKQVRKLDEEERIQYKIWQDGMNLDMQMRGFYLGNIAEALDMKETADAVKKMEGVVRGKWADLWLELTTDETARFVIRSGHRRIYMLKKIGLLACGAAAAAGIALGSVSLYLYTHPEQVIMMEVNEDYKAYTTNPPVEYYEKDDEEYDRIMAYAEKNHTEKRTSEEGEDPFYISYTLPEKKTAENSDLRGTGETFAIRKDTVKDAFARIMDTNLTDDVKTDSYAFSKVTVRGEYNPYMTVSTSSSETYSIKEEDLEITEKIGISYDLVKNYVWQIQFDGKKERCEKFLKKMIPFVLPESYLTQSEIDAALDAVTSTPTSYELAKNGRFSVSYSESSGLYSITLSAPYA
ncbi:protein kinase domain-containing protein [Hespellia stercorisuis]|nr:hypothetical protein [Hespellia stercorisuis]